MFWKYAPAIMAAVGKLAPEVAKELPVAVATLDAAEKLTGALAAAGHPQAQAASHAIITTLHTDATLLQTVLAKVTAATSATSAASIIDANGNYLPRA